MSEWLRRQIQDLLLKNAWVRTPFPAKKFDASLQKVSGGGGGFPINRFSSVGRASAFYQGYP